MVIDSKTVSSNEVVRNRQMLVWDIDITGSHVDKHLHTYTQSQLITRNSENTIIHEQRQHRASRVSRFEKWCHIAKPSVKL